METPEQAEQRKARARASSKKWREAHPEKAKAANRRWVVANRGKRNEARRAWRYKNLVRALVTEARARAKARGVTFAITPEDVPPIGVVCPLLGHSFYIGPGRSPFAPSLDRIDPSRGYVPGNVWIVGYRANLIKNDGTAEEHEAIAAAMRGTLSGCPSTPL